jgi:hypothetical protein
VTVTSVMSLLLSGSQVPGPKSTEYPLQCTATVESRATSVPGGMVR